MGYYRRDYEWGRVYFLTQVTYGRQGWLCREEARSQLRQAINQVRQKYPFQIDAFVLLPDHFHGVWTLPEGKGDFLVRMQLIKTYVTRWIGEDLRLDLPVSASREKRRERNLWQRQFWEHRVRDEKEFAAYCDYIHINPVKHGLCKSPTDWQWSTVHKFIEKGSYPPNWNTVSTGYHLDVGLLGGNDGGTIGGWGVGGGAVCG